MGCSPQAPLSTGFPRQEYWSGLPFPPPGDLPGPGIELTPPGSAALQVDSLPLCHMGCVVSWVHEWESYSNHCGGRADMARNWATAHCLVFDGWPWNCHGASGVKTFSLPICYNECILRVEA